MAERCPRCHAPAFRTQRSYGVVAVYPCLCWLPERSKATACDMPRSGTIHAKVSQIPGLTPVPDLGGDYGG